VHIVNFEGLENIHCIGPAHRHRLIMVADKKKDSYPGLRQALYAPGKLTLAGLIRITTSIGVASEDHQMDAFAEGIIYCLIEARREVGQPRVQPRCRVDSSVGLDAKMRIGQVEQSNSSHLSSRPS